MKRDIYKKLKEWKSSKDRKPLLLMGARQVGKTYIIQEFGKKDFQNIHYLNFEKDKTKYAAVFTEDIDPRRIISDIEIIDDIAIDFENDLLVFDEIQEIPQAITSLKYFCEEVPDLAVICAGSHIGLSFSESSFPVGKVNFLHLYPMSFKEYLYEINEKLAQYLKDNDIDGKISPAIHEKLWVELKKYYIVGGMPDAVKAYSNLKDNQSKALEKVREVQQELIKGYQSDFSKHSGKINANHINSVFTNIPQQIQSVLDSSVRRFRFKDIITGKSKFSQLIGPIDWLIKTGLILKVNINEKPQIPLRVYCKENMFKLFIFDIGILGCMLELPFISILKEDYSNFKGFIAENFVAQELVCSGIENLYSWTERNSEIEFLHINSNNIIPIEVKSGNRTKSKSLSVFVQKYSPKFRIKLSAKAPDYKDGCYNLPLYMAGKINMANYESLPI